MTDIVLEWVSGGDLLDYIVKREGLRECYKTAHTILFTQGSSS